jgi:hypothetical protein
MSKTTKQFHAEEEAKKPFDVWLVHDFGRLEKVVQGWATKVGLYVHWPLAGDYLVHKRTGRVGRLPWVVEEKSFAELKCRQGVLSEGAWEFRAVAQSVPHPDR